MQFFQQPVQSSRVGERRASSPFQNGRTEVLIGEPEGGPRSPRGSTSSAINDSNFLATPEEKDYPEPICRSVNKIKFTHLDWRSELLMTGKRVNYMLIYFFINI